MYAPVAFQRFWKSAQLLILEGNHRHYPNRTRPFSFLEPFISPPKGASSQVMAWSGAGVGCELWLFRLFLFFSFFAHRKPQALHRVLGPLGPFLHSGESRVPILGEH